MQSPAHVSLSSREMRKKVSEATTSFQTDTVEGFALPKGFQGNIYLTITSNWDTEMECQVPLLFTINFGKSARDYQAHFDLLMSLCPGENVEDFLQNFVGNTSDYSDAIKNGFVQSIQHTVRSRYNSSKIIEVEDIVGMYRLCKVHYRRSVERLVF